MKTDQRLQHDVMQALNHEPLLHGGSSTSYAELGVRANNGVITLTGHVDNYQKKMAVEHAAKAVPGVRAIAEEIDVSAGRTNRISDTEIARAALDKLRKSTNIPDEWIIISVENGFVKLEGEVEWGFQREAAQQELEGLEGVVKIINLISIRSELKVFGIIGKIQQALQRIFQTKEPTLYVSGDQV